MSTDVDQYEPNVLRVLQSKEETKAYYNKIAKIYDFQSEHAEQPMREKGLAKLDARPGERLLEIGFGTGHCLVKTCETVGPEGKVMGIDISDSMLKLSRELLANRGLGARAELTCGCREDAVCGRLVRWHLHKFHVGAFRHTGHSPGPC